MTYEKQKLTGSFYTEGKVAESVTNWAIRGSDDYVLEPSFGDGIFIDKAFCRFRVLGNMNPNITAVEIQPEVVDIVRKNYCTKRLQTYAEDFLSLDLNTQFDVVIGNPPYVGIKNLPIEQITTARKALDRYSVHCPNNGSLWLPFILHAITALKTNGRLAFVMPFEITYVRYAFGLWRVLAQSFSHLSICRVYEDFFPNVDVETILLFAEGKGGHTDHVTYYIYDTVDDLLNSKTSNIQTIALHDIVSGKKPFVSTLLASSYRNLFEHIKESDLIEPIIRSCKFKIGYVSADKNYFHPNPAIAAHYSIPEKNLLPAILNAKELNGDTGIGLEVIKGECSSKLYLPKCITDGDRVYIQSGETEGVQHRYKCRMRYPWYVTPNVEIPDVILSVFGEVPKMVSNSGKYVVSNSLLCGYLNGISSQQLICRWYNSLTLLSLELNVHSLGGGSFVIIPGEADKLEIVKNIPQKMIPDIFNQLDKVAKEKGVGAAYRLGDHLVLQEIFGLSDDDIMTIREAIQILSSWRNPTKRRTVFVEQDNVSGQLLLTGFLLCGERKIYYNSLNISNNIS